MNNNNDLVAEIKAIELQDPTAIVLAGMLTENTGRAMMDSGDAYGRNWERNQGLTVESFIQAPKISVDKYGCVDIDLFHYLKERIEFMPHIQEAFDEFASLEENKDENWYTVMSDWCEKFPSDYGGFNSYNHDCYLSQTIQGDFFTYNDGDTYLILQIHGGADVRGGYTAPKIFSVYNEPHIIFDWDSYTIQSVERNGEHISIDVRDGDVINNSTGDYIGGGYSIRKDDPDRDPLMDCLDSDKLDWDEDRQTFKCPDGDGWLEYIEPMSY
jgi:hypothetical protein